MKKHIVYFRFLKTGLHHTKFYKKRKYLVSWRRRRRRRRRRTFYPNMKFFPSSPSCYHLCWRRRVREQREICVFSCQALQKNHKKHVKTQNVLTITNIIHIYLIWRTRAYLFLMLCLVSFSNHCTCAWQVQYSLLQSQCHQ